MMFFFCAKKQCVFIGLLQLLKLLFAVINTWLLIHFSVCQGSTMHHCWCHVAAVQSAVSPSLSLLIPLSPPPDVSLTFLTTCYCLVGRLERRCDWFLTRGINNYKVAPHKYISYNIRSTRVSYMKYTVTNPNRAHVNLYFIEVNLTMVNQEVSVIQMPFTYKLHWLSNLIL